MTVTPVQPLKRTPLHQAHLSSGARMVPFAGWEMPLQYSSILAEARAVRSSVGIFDVSHMGRLRFRGHSAIPLLQKVLTTDVSSLRVGRAAYSLVLNEKGGVIDDTILYILGPDEQLLVCNAANRETVIQWLIHWAGPHGKELLTDDTTETVMLAVQGPDASKVLDRFCPLPPSSLRSFNWALTQVAGRQLLLSRTGYTGDDGFELIAKQEDASALWGLFLEAGVTPCGLGARDILRIEAGLLLHGTDMDSTTTPMEAGLERFIHLEKPNFIGSELLKRQREEGLTRRLVGFVISSRGIPRHGYTIMIGGKRVGQVTSGTHSPILDKDIGLGYVSIEHASPSTKLIVDSNGKALEGEVVPLPFFSRKKKEA